MIPAASDFFDRVLEGLDAELEPLRFPAEDLRRRYGEAYARDASFLLEKLAQFAEQGGEDLEQALLYYARHLREVLAERQRYRAGAGPYGKSEQELEALWKDDALQRRYLHALTLSVVFNRSRYELLRDFRSVLEDFAPSQGAILEIGAGNCLNALLASPHGPVTAYEKNRLSREWQQILDPDGRIDLRIETYTFDEPAAYDLVIMIELLEHLSDPLSILRAARHVLKPSGLAYLTFAIRMPQEDHLYELTSIAQCRRMVHESGFHLWREQCLVDTYYPFDEEERWALGDDESQAVIYCCLAGKQPPPKAGDSWRQFNEDLET